MTDTHSTVFGLGHQARCLTSVKYSTDKSQFLTGTVGAKENSVCLLEYDEDEMRIDATSFVHPDEVWDIASCSLQPDLFFTSHSPVSGHPQEKRATLWQKPTDQLTAEPLHLTPLTTLDYQGIKKILWNNDTVMAMDNQCLYLGTLKEADYQHQTKLDVLPWINTSPQSVHSLQQAVWHPEQQQQQQIVVVVGGQALLGFDLRSNQPSFSQTRAHRSTVRAVDMNPNRPYHLATGGDDGLVHLWDTRQLDAPLMTLEGHSHWVWSVAFNPLQDQLLLTSGSDTLMHLHNVVSLSSATYDSDNSDTVHPPQDGLVCTLDQHEDSVYQVAWSSADVWTFASVSYAGRVVINQVPQQEKFKILGV